MALLAARRPELKRTDAVYAELLEAFYGCPECGAQEGERCCGRHGRPLVWAHPRRHSQALVRGSERGRTKHGFRFVFGRRKAPSTSSKTSESQLSFDWVVV